LTRGKSDEEVAEMLQSAIRQERYLEADQLLIDYERNRLRMRIKGDVAANQRGRG
jgi:hypothetical protein